MAITIPYKITPSTPGSGDGRVTINGGQETMMLNFVAQTDNIFAQVAAEKYKTNTAVTSGVLTIE